MEREGCGSTIVGCVGLIVILVVAGFWYLDWSHERAQERFKKEREDSASLVGANEVDLVDMSIGQRRNSVVTEISGRLSNRSRYRIKSVLIHIRYFDCPKTQKSLADCEVVDEMDEEVLQSVPPGQSRDFSQIIFPNMDTQIRGVFRWDFSVDSIFADARLRK